VITEKFLTFKKSLRIAVVVLAFGVGANLMAQTMMNGKEVRTYVGGVNMLNVSDGRIIIKVEDGSTGYWHVGSYTVVMRGNERLPILTALAREPKSSSSGDEGRRGDAYQYLGDEAVSTLTGRLPFRS